MSDPLPSGSAPNHGIPASPTGMAAPPSQQTAPANDERPLEEVAAESGPFAPPPERVLEPEFGPQSPRPIPSLLRAGPYAQTGRRTLVTIVCIGLVCLGFSHVRLVQDLGYYILPLAYLNWIAYGLFALAAAGAVKRYATADRYAYVRDGIPFVARILRKTYSIQSAGEAKTANFLTGVDYRHPETGQIEYAWIKSEVPGATITNPQRYQPAHEVGDYVTAVYLPGRFEKTARIYSLLGLNPDIGYVFKDGRPWQQGLSFPMAMLAIFGFVGAFVLIIAGLYTMEFASPIDMSGKDVLKWIVPAGLVLGIFFGFGMVRLGRYEHKQSSGLSKPTSPALLWFCGIVLGFLASAILTIVANSALDRSPPTYRDVEVVNFWQTTHHGIFRDYEIEYTELGSSEKHKYPARVEYMDEFEPARAGVIDVRKGFLGMPWIRQIYPLDLREVTSPSDPGYRLSLNRKDKSDGPRKIHLGLFVVLENDKPMPASDKLWELVLRQFESRVSEDRLGCSVKGVRDSSPELAFDLDYIREYRYAVQAPGK